VKFDRSTILIVNDIDETILELTSQLPKHDTKVIANEEDKKDDFLITHAKLAIKEAYIATNKTKYILLGGELFTIEAQNSLLKVLEEPPKNILFIIVTSSKNSILPTIFSRLQYKYLKAKQEVIPCPIDIKNLDLNMIYNFLKQNQRISKLELKELIESILYEIKNQKITLNKTQLDSFTTSIKLCDLNSRPINILNTLLLNLMNKR